MVAACQPFLSTHTKQSTAFSRCPGVTLTSQCPHQHPTTALLPAYLPFCKFAPLQLHSHTNPTHSHPHLVQQAMPGSEALATSTGPSIQAGQVGTALVLALGLGLALAPGVVLGSLLHTGGESITAALLEVAVYGE